MNTSTPRISIVGTGIAGLAVGRELRALLPASQISFHDAATQSGGRLKTVILDDDGEVVELGGARFHPEHHTAVKELVDELTLATRPYQCTLAPLQGPFFQNGREVLRDIIERLQASFDTCKPADKTYWSFRDAAARFLGEGARDLVAAATGYDSLLHPSMSFEGGMDLLRNHPETASLRGHKSNWLTLTSGLQALTSALEVDLRHSCSFNYNRGLKSLTSSNDSVKLAFDSVNGPVKVSADYVVLAMPLRDLELIQGIRVPKMVSDAVIDIPLAKAYFSFESPWWAGFGLEGQCITTSTRFRKIYFPAKGRSLQIYCDGPSALALRELLVNGTRSEIASAFADALQDAVPVPPSVQQIAEASFGWTFWERGVSFWKPGLRLMPPDCLAISDRHYFCSDLCTTTNGWVEGALTSAQTTAERIAEQERRHRGQANSMLIKPVEVLA